MNPLRTVAVLYGGESGEHSVSRVSALSVCKNLNRRLYSPILIGITKNGHWFLQDPIPDSRLQTLTELPLTENPAQRLTVDLGTGFCLDNQPLPIDFVFPVLHGTYGEDGTVQGLLELLHLPYAGSGVAASAVGMDKVLAKRIWQQNGLPVVPYAELSYEQYRDTARLKRTLEAIVSDLSFPWFVKPVNAGSSVGCSRVETMDDLDRALKAALRYDTRVLIEEALRPREIECAVIGNETPIAFPPGEISTQSLFYDYDSKYNRPHAAQLTPEAALSPEMQTTVMETAKQAYRAINAAGFARVDFFIDKPTQRLFLNEINTLPGFTQISMFPKMCEHSGLAYSDLLTQLIDLGFQRHLIRSTRSGIGN